MLLWQFYTVTRSKPGEAKIRYFGVLVVINEDVSCSEVPEFGQYGKTQCQDEFKNLSGCVLKILTAGRIFQISIACFFVVALD